MNIAKLPDPLPKVHQCGCGSQAFHLCADGRVVCLQCRYIIEPLHVVSRPLPQDRAREAVHVCRPNNTWTCDCGLVHIVNPPHPGGEM